MSNNRDTSTQSIPILQMARRCFLIILTFSLVGLTAFIIGGSFYEFWSAAEPFIFLALGLLGFMILSPQKTADAGEDSGRS